MLSYKGIIVILLEVRLEDMLEDVGMFELVRRSRAWNFCGGSMNFVTWSQWGAVSFEVEPAWVQARNQKIFASLLGYGCEPWLEPPKSGSWSSRSLACIYDAHILGTIQTDAV